MLGHAGENPCLHYGPDGEEPIGKAVSRESVIVIMRRVEVSLGHTQESPVVMFFFLKLSLHELLLQVKLPCRFAPTFQTFRRQHLTLEQTEIEKNRHYRRPLTLLVAPSNIGHPLERQTFRSSLHAKQHCLPSGEASIVTAHPLLKDDHGAFPHPFVRRHPQVRGSQLYSSRSSRLHSDSRSPRLGSPSSAALHDHSALSPLRPLSVP